LPEPSPSLCSTNCESYDSKSGYRNQKEYNANYRIGSFLVLPTVSRDRLLNKIVQKMLVPKPEARITRITSAMRITARAT
jgi:hypothetical protein